MFQSRLWSWVLSRRTQEMFLGETRELGTSLPVGGMNFATVPREIFT